MENLGNTHEHDIPHILANDINKTIKQDMMAGTRHSRCNTCYHTEDWQPDSHNLNKISNRIWYMKVLGNHDMSIYDNVDKHNTQVLDIRWRNTCNFACVYCGPDLSSKWAVELNDLSNVMEPSTFQHSKNQILNNLNSVKHVYLAGGEPLLIAENYELLTKLYEINPDATIRINTNLSMIQNNKIFDLLIHKFKNTMWTVSVDSIGDNYNYLRYPGNWSLFKENLNFLKSHTSNINFNMVWCVINAYAIFECFDELGEMGFNESAFIVQPLTGPKWLSVNNLSVTEIAKLKQSILDRMDKSTSSLYRNSLDSMLTYIDSNFNKNIERTLEKLGDLNKRRKLNFSNVLSYLY